MPEAVVAIRSAGLEDAGVLADVGAASFTSAYAASSNAEDLAQHVRENFSEAVVRDEIARPGRRFLLARVDGVAAGMARLCDGATPVCVPAARAVEVQQLYVLSGNQRYGIGRRLIDAVCAYADGRGATGIWLSAWEEADWALAFYRKVGFEAVGRQPFQVGSTTYNDLILWLPLAGS